MPSTPTWAIPPRRDPVRPIWFFPWSSRSTYPIGIALGVAVTVVVLRVATGKWATATLWAAVLAGSVPFWEGVGQGSDHLPFACSLVWAAAFLDRRRPPPTLAGAVGPRARPRRCSRPCGRFS